MVLRLRSYFDMTSIILEILEIYICHEIDQIIISDMRVVQLRRSRVAKLCLLGLLDIGVLLVIFRQSKWAEGMAQVWSPDTDDTVDQPRSMKRQAHISHPDEIPIFLGKGKNGNYEPHIDVGRVGPGENGKSHQLRVEQKQDEEKLKGVYGFNQLVSDEKIC